MKLYNTLTRQVETLEPLHPPVVTVYSCGPTVYDYPHAGNWFTYIREDILIRTLRASGYQPHWVMNITDVGHLVSDADEGEDKIEKGARREGKTAWDVAAFYTEYFMRGLQRLNVLPPQELPRATEHIAEQIALVQTLEAKGFIYVIDDGVYYDTSKFPGYATFARLDLDEQQAGARVELNTQKRNPTDFALWKFSPADRQRDMEWDSPWGKGFPGWHIECSAMSMKYLGNTLDIHAGGIDHVPVHHTNEIAQSEAATGQRFANYWLHSNHITIEGEKISKSLGNSIMLEDIEAKGISLEAFRLHVLESNYRSQSKFSWESLQAAQNRLNAWRATATLVWQPQGEGGESLTGAIAKTTQDVMDALNDDLNTPAALAAIDTIFSIIDATTLHASEVEAFRNFLEFIGKVLGLQLHTVLDVSDTVKAQIQQRQAARAEKDWQQSDTLRDALTEVGVGLRDTPAGVIWYWL